MLLQFITFRFLDFVDIFLVAILLYQVYRLIRGTVAMSIFVGIVGIYFLWRIVNSLQMELLSGILGQIMGVGVLALIIVFQQEIRRFLIILGTRYLSQQKIFRLGKLMNIEGLNAVKSDWDAIVESMFIMASSKTGALIVISIHNKLESIIQSGEALDAKISSSLLQSIFYKNSPLHDGAVVILGDRIKGAKCVLPSSERSDLPTEYGMRHRSAIGMSEQTRTLILVVSEQSGNVSFCRNGKISKLKTPQELLAVIESFYNEE